MAEPRKRGRPKGFHDKTEQNTIQSLDRAMEVLEHLAEVPGPTLTELAERLDQSPATIYRILVTLQNRGMVEIESEHQTWFIGPKAFLVGSSFLRRTGLVERSRPVMRWLMEETGETANLGIERRDQVLFVSQVETHASIRAFFPPGTQSPMHASGIGKALLAQYPAARIDKILAVGLERFTPTTFTNPDLLRRELREIHERGYSVDNEERSEGMRCIAAAIFDATGEAVAGVSVSGPVSRVTMADVDRLGQVVAGVAREISLGLGARVGTGADG